MRKPPAKALGFTLGSGCLVMLVLALTPVPPAQADATPCTGGSAR